MPKDYFTLKIRMRVDRYDNRTKEDAKKLAKETVQFQLDRDGYWLSSGDAGRVTFIRITD